MKLLSIWQFDETVTPETWRVQKIFYKLFMLLQRNIGPKKNPAPKTPRHLRRQIFPDLIRLSLVNSIGFDTY